MHSSSNNQYKTSRHYGMYFFGLCMGFGIARSVVGARKEECYRKLRMLSLKVVSSSRTYRIGTSLAKSKGLTKPRLPHPDVLALDFYAEIIEGEIPLLLGLDVMRQNRLILDFNTNVVTGGLFKGSLTISYQRWHALVTPDENYNLNTKHKLTRLQTCFFHPTAKNLFKLLPCADRTKATPDARRLLTEVTEAYENYRDFFHVPTAFEYQFHLMPLSLTTKLLQICFDLMVSKYYTSFTHRPFLVQRYG